jgi:hypothetical protein
MQIYQDGDGIITADEFKSGLNYLQETLCCIFSTALVARMTEIIDGDGDGLISFKDFFGAFRLGNPYFAKMPDSPDFKSFGSDTKSRHISSGGPAEIEPLLGDKAQQQQTKEVQLVMTLNRLSKSSSHISIGEPG